MMLEAFTIFAHLHEMENVNKTVIEFNDQETVNF